MQIWYRSVAMSSQPTGWFWPTAAALWWRVRVSGPRVGATQPGSVAAYGGAEELQSADAAVQPRLQHQLEAVGRHDVDLQGEAFAAAAPAQRGTSTPRSALPDAGGTSDAAAHVRDNEVDVVRAREGARHGGLDPSKRTTGQWQCNAGQMLVWRAWQQGPRARTVTAVGGCAVAR